MNTTEALNHLKQSRINALRREYAATDDGSFEKATAPDGLECGFGQDQAILTTVGSGRKVVKIKGISL